jgi:hypothetical protein
VSILFLLKAANSFSNAHSCLEETTFSICRQLEQIYLLTAGAVAAVTTAAGTEILADDLQIVVLLNHPT